MRRKMRSKLALLLLLLVLLLLGSLAAGVLAQERFYTLDWYDVAGGGGTFSSGGEYELGGTAGQPDAGLLSGGDYTVGGGFWAGAMTSLPPATANDVYLPVVVR